MHSAQNSYLDGVPGIAVLQNAPMESRVLLQDDVAFRISLHHHKRPITDLQFNRDGDILLTASKDPDIFLCNLQGEALGVYEGHEGSVNSISVSSDTRLLSSGSSDRRFILWDVETGKEQASMLFRSSVKHVFFYPHSTYLLVSCDDSYSQRPLVATYDYRANSLVHEHRPTAVPTSAVVDFSESKVVCADVEGTLTLLDRRMDTKPVQKQYHSAQINRVRPSWCNTFFITASSDARARIVDFEDLSVKKVFCAEEPLNDAAVFGSNDKVMCAGGVNARDVTLTRGKKDFDVCFYDIVTQRYVGCFSPHFGTINAICIHPSTEMFCSGGEDAVVCVMRFGADFHCAPFTRLTE